jgi:DNA-binding CsgD family transcriptional regulator
MRAAVLPAAADTARVAGDYQRAAVNLSLALDACREVRDGYATLEVLLGQIRVSVARGQPTAARHTAWQALEMSGTIDGVLARIRLLEHCAMAIGTSAAAPLLQAATLGRAHLGLKRWPSEDALLAEVNATPQHAELLGVADALELARDLLGAASAPVERDTLDGHLLTRREQQVARLVADGRSTRDIAATLVISQGTVRAHVEHIRTKLGIASRAQIGPRLGLSRN